MIVILRTRCGCMRDLEIRDPGEELPKLVRVPLLISVKPRNRNRVDLTVNEVRAFEYAGKIKDGTPVYVEL